MWTNKDKVLFRILHQFGSSDLERQIKRSSHFFSKLQQPPEYVMIFGYYDLSKKLFVWLNNMNYQMERFIQEGYRPLFGSDETWKKLLHPVVPLSISDKNVIPYLMEILNARYRVIRLIEKNVEIYALVTLPYVKQTFDFNKFNTAMYLYRMDDKYEKKYSKKGKIMETIKRRKI